jgi:hypothetical protein
VRFSILALTLLPPLAAPLAAQHEHLGSPYAALGPGAVPLLPEEIEQLRSGDGMGLALPAELNHFPGPKHVLELGAELALTPEQRGRVDEIRITMLEQAIAKGEEIIAAAGHLAGSFRSGEPTADAVARITGHIGALRGELQAIHLRAHVATRAALTEAQVAEYDRLRGYVTSG